MIIKRRTSFEGNIIGLVVLLQSAHDGPLVEREQK